MGGDSAALLPLNQFFEVCHTTLPARLPIFALVNSRSISVLCLSHRTGPSCFGGGTQKVASPTELTRLSQLEGVAAREAAPEEDRGQKVCTTGAIL
jgi:hypothetical protein